MVSELNSIHPDYMYWKNDSTIERGGDHILFDINMCSWVYINQDSLHMKIYTDIAQLWIEAWWYRNILSYARLF